jgi:hypothetical protein
MSVRALPIRIWGRLDLEESRRKILFLCSSIFLWAWLTLPLAQLSYLHRLGRNAGAVTADLKFLSAQQGLMVPYYRNLFWGALLLSFVGTLLIWLLPRRFANESFLSLPLGLVVGIALGHVWLDLVAPNDPRARVYPVDPTYFMLANAIAGTIAGYLKFKWVEGRAAMEAARQKFHFLAEGVIVWLAVFQVLTVYWVVGPEWTQGLVSQNAFEKRRVGDRNRTCGVQDRRHFPNCPWRGWQVGTDDGILVHRVYRRRREDRLFRCPQPFAHLGRDHGAASLAVPASRQRSACVRPANPR